MTRLTTWFDELVFAPVAINFSELVVRRDVQRLLNLGVWVVSVVDYPSAAALSHLLQPHSTSTSNHREH